VLLGLAELAFDLVPFIYVGLVPRTGHLYQSWALISNQTCLLGPFLWVRYLFRWMALRMPRVCKTKWLSVSSLVQSSVCITLGEMA